MTALLGILGAAALFVLFGWFMRGKRLSCGGEGACPSITGGCTGCRAGADGVESDHAQH